MTVKEVGYVKKAKKDQKEQRPLLFGVSKLSELEELMDSFE
jgi:hypothetical protein